MSNSHNHRISQSNFNPGSADHLPAGAHAHVRADAVHVTLGSRAVLTDVLGYGPDRIGDLADEVIYTPPTEEYLQPFTTIVPLQLLAYHISDLRGCDVDQPRNLAKSVTVE